ncbi:unnamed protein product [Psylliodes chrysocephalus]|uniref:Uncharacterized protein n=1 Tax=Psylliodes chrysocephalus TaxID=3402493 RepID=A0A9P0CRF1_9CUCU|nr:unnamed protein product [Psylliodes chrysocephala]
MGKHKKRRSLSSSDSENHIDVKTILKRLKRLENNARQLKRSRWRIHVSRLRHSRSASPAGRLAGASDDERYKRGSMQDREATPVSWSPVSSLRGVSQERINALSFSELSERVCSPDRKEEELILHNDIDLSEEVLSILGSNPEEAKNQSVSLHDALIPRWRNNVVHGLPRDEATALLHKYLVPSNLPNLTPPSLNPEIVAILGKTNLIRYESQKESQSQGKVYMCVRSTA